MAAFAEPHCISNHSAAVPYEFKDDILESLKPQIDSRLGQIFTTTSFQDWRYLMFELRPRTTPCCVRDTQSKGEEEGMY
jgi:hypothetical protein